jgi:succinoglycan biosynthesis transport protein ExoP
MYEATPGEQPGLEDYLEAIRNRKLVVLAFAVLGLLLGWFVGSSATARYSTSVQIVVNPENPSNFSKPDLATEGAMLRSQSVLAAAAPKLNPVASTDELSSNSSVLYAPDTGVLALKYTDTDPVRARDAATAIANAYVDARVAERTAKFTTQLTAANKQLTDLSAEIKDLTTQLIAQQIIANNATASQAVRDTANTQITLINAQLTDAQFRQRDVRNQATQIQSTADSTPVAAQVTQPAALPATPDGFSKNLLMVIGAFVGIIIGLVAAFVLDRLDRRARKSSDVEGTLGAPVLASVPSFNRGNTGPGGAVVMLRTGDAKKLHESREAYRRIRSSLEFLLKRTGAKSVLVTSARPGEGKSVTATNLAIAAAQAGRHVVLVSADLHRPTVERLLSIPNERGLADWLQDEADVLLQEVLSVPNLSVISCGRELDNAGELFASSRFADLIDQLEATFDLVVLDTPPMLSTADASAIASHVGGVLVVTDGRRTDAEDLAQVRGALQLVGGRLLGAVLNRATARSSAFSRDDYSYKRSTPGRSA